MQRGNYDHRSVALYEELRSAAPELPEHCEFYWTVFHTVATMRPMGMAAGKLRWDDTMKVADHYGLSFQEKENLWFIIRAMDGVVLNESDKKKQGSAK